MHHDLRLIEAILFAATDPVPERALAERLPEDADVEGLMAELAGHYSDRGVQLTQVAGGWTFRTAEDLAVHLRLEKHVVRKPSRAAVETMAVIAYHQPVTRSEVEEIRGVAASRGTFDVLLEADWIRPVGRRNSPGRPVTWGTSPGFLEHFGLASLADLPGIDELKAAGLLDTRPASVIVGIGRPADDPVPDEQPEPVLALEEPLVGDEPLSCEEALPLSLVGVEASAEADTEGPEIKPEFGVKAVADTGTGFPQRP